MRTTVWVLVALLCDTAYGAGRCSAEYYRDLVLGPTTGVTLVAAHRGYHAVAPENSLSAIEAAIDGGSPIIEVDIRKTADDVYVLLHDATLDRTTNGSGPVAEQSYEAVRRLRLLDAQGNLTQERVPTLEEALTLNAGRALIMLDSKVDHPNDVRRIGMLVNALDKADEVILYDFHPEIAMAFRRAVPGALTMLRIKERKLVPWYLEAYRFELLVVEPAFLTAPLGPVAEFEGRDLFVNLMGRHDSELLGGDVRFVRSLVAADVRVIQTDHPVRLRRAIASDLGCEVAR